MGTLIDITGEKYGALTVVRLDRIEPGQGAMWRVRCDCGSRFVTRAQSLRRGLTKSCGCVRQGRLEPGRANCNELYISYRNGAKKRGFAFDITRDDFAQITQERCFYCNSLPNLFHDNISKGYNGPYLYNGLDRYDNEEGYTLDNLVACCWPCNKMKNNMHGDDFLARIKAIYEECF